MMRDGSLAGRAAFYNTNTLKLGLFGVNCSSGRTVTMAPERWSGTWDDNLRLAKLADAAGIEFLLPLGRWKGYGGASDFEGASLEPLTWATAVLAKTERICAFSTVHAPMIHPIVAAKQMVMADLVGEGRFGLNIVCGWNEDEFQMFGIQQRDHEKRYEFAQEWIDAIKQMWSHQGGFDFDGQFVKLKDVRAEPKPFGGGRPLIMNAGASPTGQAFALRNCDALFTSLGRSSPTESAEHIRNVKAIARKGGRDIEVYTIAVVTCRKSTKEAQDYYNSVVFDQADWGAIENLMRMQGVKLDEMSADEAAATRRRWAVGHGGNLMIGDPDLVATELARLSELGIRGVGLSIINYADELPYIVQEVLPRLERLGLRNKVSLN